MLQDGFNTDMVVSPALETTDAMVFHWSEIMSPDDVPNKRVDMLEQRLFPIGRLWLAHFELVCSPVLVVFRIFERIEEIASSRKHIPVDRVILGRKVLDVHAWAFSHHLSASILTLPDVLKPDTGSDRDFGSEGPFSVYLADAVAEALVIGFGG